MQQCWSLYIQHCYSTKVEYVQANSVVTIRDLVYQQELIRTAYKVSPLYNSFFFSKIQQQPKKHILNHFLFVNLRLL